MDSQQHRQSCQSRATHAAASPMSGEIGIARRAEQSIAIATAMVAFFSERLVRRSQPSLRLYLVSALALQ